MQSKSTRGVQAHDVALAADQLIATGQRPTIERVRQTLGRGSPNTIAPLLDAWFAQLGPRLGLIVEASGEGSHGPSTIPTAVWEAVKTLWEQALVNAGDAVQREFAQQSEALREQRVALEVDRAALDVVVVQVAQREQQHQQMLEHLQSEVSHWRDNAQGWQTKASDLERELRAAHEALGEATQERNAERRRHDEQVQQLVGEQRRQAEASHAEQQRLLSQIDQGRLAVKNFEKKLTDGERSSLATQRDIQRANSVLDERYRAAQLEIAALRARCEAQETHVKALHAQLAPIASPKAPRPRLRARQKKSD